MSEYGWNYNDLILMTNYIFSLVLNYSTIMKEPHGILM